MAKKENEDIKETKYNSRLNVKEAVTKPTETKKENTTLKTGADREEKKTGNPGINSQYKTENCKVLAFNPGTNELDIEFKGYGIRLHSPGVINSAYVPVSYYGEIGKPGFRCQVQEG